MRWFYTLSTCAVIGWLLGGQIYEKNWAMALLLSFALVFSASFYLIWDWWRGRNDANPPDDKTPE